MEDSKDPQKGIRNFVAEILIWIRKMFGSLNPFSGLRKRKRDYDKEGPSKIYKRKKLSDSDYEATEAALIPRVSTSALQENLSSGTDLDESFSSETNAWLESLSSETDDLDQSHASNLSFDDIIVPSTSTGITSPRYKTKVLSKRGDKPGKGRIQRYPIHVPLSLKCLEPSDGNLCFLHTLKIFIPEVFDTNAPGIKVKLNGDQTSREFGLILTKELPNVNSFTIVTEYGTAKISAWFNQVLELNSEQLSSIEIFHKYVIQEVIYINRESVHWNPSYSNMPALLVPVKKNDDVSIIDWDFMKHIRKSSSEDYMTHQLVENDVVRKFYKEPTPPRYYHVRKITEKTIYSIMDSEQETETFQDFYISKYNVTVETNSKLVQVCKFGIQEKRTEYKQYLIPEMSIKHPSDSFFLLKSLMLPTILYRLNSLLKAEDLRKSIISARDRSILIQTEDNWNEVNFGAVNRSLRNKLKKLCIEYESPEIHSKDIIKAEGIIQCMAKEDSFQDQACPFAILNAITLESTEDEINLERSEFLGDSYLQYIISIKVYLENIDQDKGVLNNLRTNIVKNFNLLEKATLKNIADYLITNRFEDNKWIPPSYVEMKEGTSTQLISDKCVADSVESLIGIHLITGGHETALYFMQWLGLLEDMRIENFPPEIGTENLTNDNVIIHSNMIEEIENAVEYTFRKKYILVQALTHASYNNLISQSNQRLIYAGEALYQYIITRSIFEKEKFSPFHLTVIRQPFLHKIYLGCIAVKLRLHRNILYRHLPNLDIFLQTCDENEDIIYFKEHGTFPGQKKSHEVDLDVPKCLKEVLLALIAALYIDARSINEVWRLLGPMLTPSLNTIRKPDA